MKSSLSTPIAFVLLALLTGLLIQPLHALSVNDRVRATTDSLKIRQAPPGLADTGGRHNTGDQGRIVAGPSVGTAGGYTGNWWQVDFDTGADGWAAEIYLERVTTVTVPAAPVASTPGTGAVPGQIINTTTPQLTWTRPVGATGYEVQVSREPYGAANLVFENRNLGDVASVTVSPALTAGLNYRWNMYAKNSAGLSPLSNTLYFTIQGLPPDNPVVTVTSPNGGENWMAGSNQNVSWSIGGNTAQISYQHVAFSTDGGTNYTNVTPAGGLAAGTRNWAWALPNTAASQSRIRVRAMDASGNILAQDFSNNNFNIEAVAQPPTVLVTSPNGGDNWTASSNQTISWTISGSTTQINYQHVALSTDSGATFSNISPASGFDASTRNMTWTLPNTASTQCRIRVRAMDVGGNILAYDASDANFTITGNSGGGIAAFDRALFFSRFATGFSTPSPAQRTGMDNLLSFLERDPQLNLSDAKQVRWAVYIFATTRHETAYKYQPIPENWTNRSIQLRTDRPAYATNYEQDYFNYWYNGVNGNGNYASGDGYTFRGRGYVQLTARNNYQGMQNALSIPLVSSPDLALDPSSSYRIMSHGMRMGSFTTRRLEDYITSTGTDYFNARRIVNGIDRAQDIADAANLLEPIFFASLTTSSQVAAPVMSPAGGAFQAPVSVTLASATSGATIHFTTNGQDPTQSSTAYSGPISVTASATVKARAFKTGLTQSEVTSGVFTISAPVTVTINSVTPSPAQALPGQTMTLTAQITASAGRSVLQGASLVPAGANSGYISDPANDRTATLPAGTSAQTRPFTIPSGTPLGTYDLLYALWQDGNGDGIIGSGDTVQGTTFRANGAVQVITAPPRYTLTVSADPPEGGSVTRNPSVADYAAGALVTVTAVPNAGYRFDHWAGDATGTINPASVTMSSNRVVQAVFAGIPALAILPTGDISLPAAAGASTGATHLSIINQGQGDLAWTASSSAAWLRPAAAAGSVTGGNGATNELSYSWDLNPNATTRTATIVITATGVAGSPETFTFTQAAAPNMPPIITNVADRSVNEDTATAAIPFTVGDTETSAGSLTVTRTTSNTALVPLTGVVLGGAGANRTVTITPAANQFGSTTITLSVSDGSATVSDSFVLTVNPVNDLPVISNVANLATNEDTPTAAIAFTISDLETPAANLTMTGGSSLVTLVPLTGFGFGGNGGNRTVIVSPALNQSGTSTITLTVSDGTATANDTFVLTVNAVNDPPTISNVADLSLSRNTTSAPIAFTIGDVETATASLTVTRVSSNTTLLPPTGIVLGGNGVSRTVTLTPAANQSGTATVTLTVGDGSLNATDTFVVTVTNVLPLAAWKQTQFGANAGNDTIAGDLANPDGDQLVNLLEYTFGGNPNSAASAPAPVSSVLGNRVSLTFTRTVANTDVTIIVQGADSLQGPWTNLAQSTGGNAMTVLTAGAVVTETGTGATRSVEVRDSYTLGQAGHPRRFLRVKVSH